MLTLSEDQKKIIHAPIQSRIFLSGPPGSGKTTASVERLKHLLTQNIPADQILLLTPQRTLQDPYLDFIHSPETAAGGEVAFATVGGLARRMLDLFWPLAAEAAGVSHPENPPVFLTLETAQYYMSRLVRPHLKEGWFDSVVMDRNRIYSQILDNLNKAALVGFSHEEIGERLTAAWSGDIAQRRVYTDVQACANEFRQFCLHYNLLDFSLQIELFSKLLWNDTTVRTYLHKSYRHLIYDNIEEDAPVSHDIISEWLPDFDSALLIFDENAGYRQFLGADPLSAQSLGMGCQEFIHLSDSYVMNGKISALSESLEQVVVGENNSPEKNDYTGTVSIIPSRFYPEMLDAVTAEVVHLIKDEGVAPSEIVVLSPYLSDALRFSIQERLENAGIPTRSHRPSRSLREEPASLCLITLAMLSHPSWNIHPNKYDLAYTLVQAIENLDLTRSQLLTEIIYRQKEGALSSFEKIKPDVQERITHIVGSRYTYLREWINNYIQEGNPLPLDLFFRRLFGEVLSQVGFGFHNNLDAARVASNLIESIQKYRWAIEPTITPENTLDIGYEYLTMLNEGVISALYVSAWETPSTDAVLLAPAFTFLMSNRPVEIQFWLDASSSGWYQRLFQPLTHPYVLSRNWAKGNQWTDSFEFQANNQVLARLVGGLLHRCKSRLYLGMTDLSENGFEQRGTLIRAFQKILTLKDFRV